MDETTPLLYNQTKHKKKIMDCGTIMCKDNNNVETIEIIISGYNINYYFDITSTNCKKLNKLCSTINGMLITLHKANTNKACIISWKAYKYT